MLEALERREVYGIAGVFVLGLAMAFVSGAVVSGSTGITGAITADTGGSDSNAASKAEIRQKVQQLMDQRLQRQRQMLTSLANRSANISRSDLSINAQVTDVSESRFGSLYKVTVTVSGTVPSRTGGLRDMSQEQTLYISQDGRYLFQPPTDLQQPQQPRRPAPQTQ
ncbi:MAG: hypothetical protein SVU32_05415 [Candidatus Nanohaloarchaea archaeon]|nr:hypothetical protein [Candidatus Nanohaloarchaea archaeon]